MTKTFFVALLILCLLPVQLAWSSTHQSASDWQFDSDKLVLIDSNSELAIDTPLGALIGIRIDSDLNTDDVALIGPQGVILAKVFVSQKQKLVFIQPNQELFPASDYTVVLKTTTDESDTGLQTQTIGFSTERIKPAVWDERLRWKADISTNTDTKTDSNPKQGLTLEQLSAHFDFVEAGNIDDEIWLPNSKHLGNQWRTDKPLPQPIATAINQALSVNSIKAAGDQQRLFADEIPETLITGQIFKLNDEPLANVQINIGDQAVTTDEQGRYTLSGLSAGHHELIVDGRGAGEGSDQFAEVIVGIEVYADQTTPIKPMYLPKVRTQDWIDIPSPLTADLIVQSDLMPGFEIHLPAGTVLRDREGNVVRKIATVPMPLDRLPIEYPVNTPLHMTLQPGGMQVENIDPDKTGHMQFVYPNYAGKAPGTRSGFLNYDPTGKGWYTYGYGQVSDDGLQVIPDATTVVYQATGFGVFFGAPPPAENTPNECSAPARDGDPVDLATGLFIHETQGPQIQDVMPIDMRTKYRPGDDIERGFGKGTTHSYGAYFYFAGEDAHEFWPELSLVLPDCSVLVFEATTPSDGVFSQWQGIHDSSPTPFYGATLHRNVGQAKVIMTMRDGNVWEFSATGGHLLNMTDRYGRRTEITHSNGGQITRISSPSGRFVDAFYSGGHISQLTDLSGRSWLYGYNGAGYLSQITYPDNSIEQFTYDASNRMTQVHNRLGQRMVLNTYDSEDRISAQELADGAQYAFNYITDANGLITTAEVTKPNGTIRQVTFNEAGYSLTDTEALGTALQRTMTYDRDTDGFVNAIVDPLQRRTELVYDSERRLASLTLLAGTSQARISTINYNTDHDMTLRVDANGDSVSYVYDHLRRVTRVSDSHGRHIDLSYNANHQVSSVVDHLGRDTQLGYQLFDLVSVTNTHNNTWHYETDSLGRVIAQIDAINQRTEYSYDINDDLIELTDPRNQLTQYSYDALGNILSLIDPQNQTTIWGYDNRQRVTSYTDGLNRIATCSYASDERSVSCTDRASRVIDYTLDDLNRLDTIDYRADNSQVTLNYDLADRLLGINDTLSGSISYSYNGLDQLLQEITPTGTMGYQYDARLRLDQILPSGLTPTQYDYDSRDRLTQIDQGGEIVSMAYDAYDRRISTTLPNGISTLATFNDLDQLTELSYEQVGQVIGNLTYFYDEAGQIIEKGGSWDTTTQATTTTAQGIADAHNQLQQFNGQSFIYDLQGNLTDDGVSQYTYDSRDRLTQITGPTGISIFQYDAANRRVSKTIGGQTTEYRYFGLNPIAEIQNGVTYETLSGLGIDERYGRDDDNGSRSYFLTDHQGSTIGLTSPAGNLQARYHYEAYGETQFEAVQAGFTSSNPYQYTGRENDNNGQYYYRARYYSPTNKRFTQSDPLGFIDGPNMYAYVIGNPISYTDPTGEAFVLLFPAIGFVTGLLFDVGLQLLLNGGNINCVDFGEVLLGGVLGIAGGAAGGLLLKSLGRLISKLKATRRTLPKNPDDLLRRGYRETSHPDAARHGHRTYENPNTKDRVRFDKGKPGADGFEGTDHYHRYNPNATNKRNQYLDANGKPCARGCDASHLLPGAK